MAVLWYNSSILKVLWFCKEDERSEKRCCRITPPPKPLYMPGEVPRTGPTVKTNSVGMAFPTVSKVKKTFVKGDFTQKMKSPR